MKTIGLWMVLLGLGLALFFLCVGPWWRTPWSTPSAVLFGLGLAYAGLCGRRAEPVASAVPLESVPRSA